MPARGDVHIDAALTNLSVGRRVQGFIGDLVVPRVKVQKQSDKYFIHGSEALTIEDTVLAPNAESKGTDWAMTSATYLCTQYALHGLLSDVVVANADPAIDPRIATMDRVLNKVDLHRENRCATLLTTAASYPAALKRTLATAEQWDNYNSSSSDPRNHIATALGKIQNLIGIVPNTLTIGWKVALALSNHPQILAGKTQSTNLNAVLTSFDLPPVLFGLNLRIGLAGYNTALIGQTVSIADVWGDYAIVHYVEPNPGLETLSHCVTFDWASGYPSSRMVSELYEPKIRALRIEVLDAGLDEVLINTNAGYLLSDTLSASFLA